MATRLNYSQLVQHLIDRKSDVVDKDILKTVVDRLKEKHGSQSPAAWQSYAMVWPPRLVQALADGKCVCFFGAGLSMSAGAPSWSTLLNQHLKLGKDFVDDEDLRNDPLTLAEIAAQRIGTNVVQSVLRDLTKTLRIPTTSHMLLSALRGSVYITTNYDQLFEEAWKLINPTTPLRVLVNDGDLRKLGAPWTARSGNEAYLLKIHGCVGRTDEHMILTRSDYRNHYRSNHDFFGIVSETLKSNHVLFSGFSHRDPEVTRLVEDAIHEYTGSALTVAGIKASDRPHFYSLQFDMHKHTPEIFAARGLVALRPPFVAAPPEQLRGASLGLALAELSVVSNTRVDKTAALDQQLDTAIKAIATPLGLALDELERRQSEALREIKTRVYGKVCNQAMTALGPLASQGVWLLDADGNILDLAVPNGLDGSHRLAFAQSLGGLSGRQYFRVAKTFRKAFVGDSMKSVFNSNSTVFLCAPILEGEVFSGLLFAATQIGNWSVPYLEAGKVWNSGKAFVLLDSNGIVLLPPNDEFQQSQSAGLSGNELSSSNIGYAFDRLLLLSRRDALASHIVENIVPLSQDDDVFEVAADLTYYSVVAEIPRTRWKLAICSPLFK